MKTILILILLCCCLSCIVSSLTIIAIPNKILNLFKIGSPPTDCKEPYEYYGSACYKRDFSNDPASSRPNDFVRTAACTMYDTKNGNTWTDCNRFGIAPNGTIGLENGPTCPEGMEIKMGLCY